MPIPQIEVSSLPPADSDVNAIVLAVSARSDEDEQLAAWPDVAPALAGLGFTGAIGATARIWVPAAAAVPLIVVGLGDDPDEKTVRTVVGQAVRTATGVEALGISVPGAPQLWAAAAEGAILGGYRFEGYKSTSSPQRASRVVVFAPVDDAEAAGHLARVRATGTATALIKDLIHTPAEWLGPAELADAAVAAVADLDVAVEVYDEQRLAAEGFGGILGVAQGSSRPPRLVRLDYAPAGATRHVALVGKGITFDTGGLSLKPPAAMVGMKFDMGGAATVVATIQAAARIGIPVRVSGWLCLTDNMPSGSAIRPGDVLRTYNGTTVEVLNTDAEGRLVLADGLAAASATSPDVIVDVATLTGAIIVALGARHTGVMGDDEAVAAYLAAAESQDEPAWHLPLPEYMEEELDSPIADLQNAKIGDTAGGALFAGLFLRRFVGHLDADPAKPRIPWVHLDIAGSGTTKSAYGWTEKGPTAQTLRSLLRFIEGETA